jgi:hypothetical protein
MASRMSHLDTKILMPELPTTPIFGVGSKRFEEPHGHRIARTSTEMFTGSSSAPLADRARGAWPHSGYRERDLGSG